MLATTSPITAPSMTAPLDLNGARAPLVPAESGQRQFKGHKNLPRPERVRSQGSEASSSKRRQPQPDLALDTSVSSTGSQTTSPHTLKHQHKKIGNGPELPPTPPTHSRTSSSSHSALPSSPTLAENSVRTPKNTQSIPPTTPPDQRSPPTPDVTPPQPLSRPKALRPQLADRGTSRTNTFDSRTDSFRTAREEPLSSEEEDGKSTVKAAVASGRTSQSTVRKGTDNTKSRMPNPQAIDMALARLGAPAEDGYTPRTRGELAQFDGDWGAANKAERDWHDNSNTTVTMKKTRQPVSTVNKAKRDGKDVVEDANNIVVSTGATKAVRNMSLNEKSSPKSSRKSHSGTRSSSGPSYSDSSVSTSQKRSSGVSSRSFTSTVEAFLVDAPQQPPQRQRTLRHVRKQSALRDPIPPFSEPPAPVPERGRGRSSKPPITNHRPEHSRHDSVASNTTVTSVASGKARREVWKNGGIPVVVIPDRRTSRSQSREPSLRSTSSRRSKRTQSLSSAPMDMPSSNSTGPVFERPERRSRAFSLSDSSDTRTIDYPPAIPVRSSSLSAPTSRNTSRVNSLTTDSLRARDAIQGESFKTVPESPILHESKITKSPPRLASPFFASPKADSESDGRFDLDRSEDTTRKGPARHTPFSIVSIETNGTAPEVSEAIAMQLYAHQNSSLLMVNHSSRPSEVPELPETETNRSSLPEQPTITMTGPENEVPVTPPQPQFTLEDVDSPLRNPRSPPEPPVEPPAITFTSATPSGVTPAPDKDLQMGNYFDTMAEVPSRRPSLVERALNRGRRSSAAYPPNSSKSQGLLKRAFSLPRRRSSSRRRGLSPNTDYPQEGFTPPEENKLHPFWRPQWSDSEFEDDYHEEDHVPHRDDEDIEDDGTHLRYPPIDNRPAKPKRRFSDKMKRTFAIMPLDDKEDYAVDDVHGPERRTIRRTSSGNLRVMRRRFSQSDRPYTAPDEEPQRSFWRGSSANKRTNSQSRRRFSLDEQLDEIRGLSRRLSERRREKRTQELRQKISGPRDVRDGVEEMLRSGNPRDERHPV